MLVSSSDLRFVPVTSAVPTPGKGKRTFVKPRRPAHRAAPARREAGEPVLSIGSMLYGDRFSIDCENEILEVVKEKKLYNLGRFSTSDDSETLAWINVGPLLNARVLLPLIVREMELWLHKVAKSSFEERNEKAVLLGLDCWGAVLASQLTVSTGVPNLCVGARGHGRGFIPSETVNNDVVRAVDKVRTVVLVSDVVVTGSTIRFVHDDISRRLKSQRRDHVWLSVCVISSLTRELGGKMGFLNGSGFACGALPVPIVQTAAMPSAQILPRVLSFG